MAHVASAPNESSGLSLLSLSAAAASAAPIPLSPPSGPTTEISLGYNNSNGNNLSTSHGITHGNHVGSMPKHRRLSSTGKAKRRLSDARDAATRPSATSLQTAAVALSSLATLSLSSSPPTQSQGLPSHNYVSSSFTSASNALSPPGIPIPRRSTSVHPSDISQSVPLDDGSGHSSPPNGVHVHDSNLTKGGKRKGTIFTCESCSKVYRHPSCLIKHRWEHSPQWREASKFVLSKHQQVQLLEAAAILSHLSPDTSGTSLPEDRSLWPSFLSGGALPPPANANSDSPKLAARSISSSVPATSLLAPASAPAAGPRLHDYSIPSSVNGGGLTQLRPGLLAVPTSGSIESNTSDTRTTSGSLPVPVPNSEAYRESPSYDRSDTWGSPASSSHYTPHSYQSPPVISHSYSKSYSDGTGGWSLPRSSLRSMSRSSRSRSPSGSGSGSKSDDENEPVEVEDSIGDLYGAGKYGYSSRGRVMVGKYGWKREDDDMSIGFSVREEDEEEEDRRGEKETDVEEAWDGMEMDMVMD